MNTFGNKFRVSVFGESHGPYVGVTMDGVPAGLELCEDDFFSDIGQRRSGAEGTTSRKESDAPIIVSGVYEGHATGAPLTVLFANSDVRSADYDIYRNIPRPGHADFSAGKKFGMWQDPRGGGHFSGRLTLPLVAAGTVAKKILYKTLGDSLFIQAELVELGGTSVRSAWSDALVCAAKEGDSIGGVVACTAKFPAGIGEPFWNSVESMIAHAVFSIPGVRGIEFGDGFRAAAMKGSEHNDPFGTDGLPVRNGSGGVNGGITNGADVVFRVAFKPTSSIAREQETLNFKTGEIVPLICPGRHDTCFALRTPVIVEAVTAIVFADLI